MASRHLARSIAMQSLFEWDFDNKDSGRLKEIVARNKAEYGPGIDEEYVFIDRLVEGTTKNISKIDTIIEKAAPEWPVEQIAAIDKTILRMAIYEMQHEQDTPPRVVINEAVELAKAFGGDNSSKFINGVLGTLYRDDPRYAEDEAAGLPPLEALSDDVDEAPLEEIHDDRP